MSTVIVTFNLSDAAKRAALIATGDQPKSEQKIAFDLTHLTPEQRAAFADFGLQVEIKSISDDGSNYQPLTSRWFSLDSTPTVDEAIAHIARMIAENAAASSTIHARQLAQATDKIDSYIAKAENAIARRNHGEWLETLTEAIYKECSNLAQYNLLRRHYAELEPAFKAEKETRDKATQDAKEAAAEAKRQIRLMWAREHGSDRLRRGMEAGHSCDRLFLIEKCAAEYPDCTLDYEKAAETQDRACPTTEELDAFDSMLESHPTGCAVTIIWLTAAPSDKKPSADYDDFYPSAALEIDDDDYPRMIYKIL